MAIGGILDDQRRRLTKSVLDRIVPDVELAKLLWKLAREGDGRVAVHLAERKWGRVRHDDEHDGPAQIHLVVSIPVHYPGMDRSAAAINVRPSGLLKPGT